MLLLGVTALISCLVLSGCSPVVRAAVRVNDDGTVDFAACTTIVSVETAVAEVTLHADRGDRDAETRSLELVTGLADVSEGETMTFSGLPEDWDELEVYVYGREGGAVKGIDRDEVIVGEWFGETAGVSSRRSTPQTHDARSSEA